MMNKSTAKKGKKGVDKFLEEVNKESKIEGFSGVPAEEVDSLLETIGIKEEKILNTLLSDVLTDSLAFNGGVQRFLDVVSNQLNLQEIEFNSSRYEQIIELLTDIKVLTSFLKLQRRPGEQDKRLENLSLDLSIKAVSKFLGLGTEETSSTDQQITNLNSLLISFLKDFSTEVSRNAEAIKAQNNSFLRELKTLLKKN